jgi:TolB-like protein
MALKKRIWVLLFIGLSAAAVSAQEGADRISLAEAVKGAAGDFMGGIPARSKVAVTSFSAPSASISEYTLDEITKELVNNRGFTVVDRRYLEEARKELDLNMYGEISEENAQEFGRFLGAQIVIFGSIKPFGKDYRMQARALQVETGEILVMYTATIDGRDIDRITGGEKDAEWDAWWAAKKEYAFRNSWGLGGYVMFSQYGLLISNGGGADADLH